MNNFNDEENKVTRPGKKSTWTMLNRDHTIFWRKLGGAGIVYLEIDSRWCSLHSQAERAQTKLTPGLLSAINLLKAMSMSKNISIIENIILWVIL